MKEYLADGVYAEFKPDEERIVLTAENGIEATDTIYLDRDVLAAFMRFVAKLQQRGTHGHHV